MKLDKKQSYGQISGDHHGAVYEQHGRIFDADGEEIIIPSESVDDEVQEQVEIAAPKAIKPKTAAKTATKTGAKGPKRKAVPPVSPPDTAVAVVPKSAVDDQLAAQSQ